MVDRRAYNLTLGDVGKMAVGASREAFRRGRQRLASLSLGFAEKPRSVVLSTPKGYGSNVYEGYTDSSITYADPDEIVGKHGVAIYREMMRRDEMISAAVKYRQLAQVSTGWRMVPASEDPKDVEAADFVDWALRHRMKGSFNQSRLSILDAIPMGFSLHEMIWGEIETDGPWKGKRCIDRLVHRNPAYIGFKLDQHGDIEQIVQESATGGADIPYEPHEVVYHVYDPRDGNPYGSSPLRQAYRWYFCKEGAVKLWARYLEKYGSPIAIGRYPASGSDSDHHTTMMTYLQKLRSSMVAAMPEGWNVELTNPNHYMSVNLFEKMITRADRAESRAILLPSLVMESSEVGAYALGKEHTDQFVWVLMSDQEAEADTENEQLVQRLVEMNFENVGIPTFEPLPFKQEDLLAQSQILLNLINAGASIPAQEELERFGRRVAGEDEDVMRKGETPEIQTREAEQFAASTYTEAESVIDFAGIDRAEDLDADLGAENMAVILESIAQEVAAGKAPREQPQG